MTVAETISAPDALSTVRDILARHAGDAGALLPILHDVQEALGHVPATTVGEIAHALNLSRAEVHGVVTYYHFFRAAPPGRHVVQVCRAESCQARGADELLAQAEQLLGCKSPSTRADGGVTLEPVYCLGLCALSPAVMVDERVHGRMTAGKLAGIVAGWEISQ
jgi:formate dehydrogenase subunit gamma